MNYISTGNLVKVFGCAFTNFSVNYNTKYNVGDTLWLRSQALKGKYEKVVLKKVAIFYNGQNNFYTKVQYFDTFNAFHDERELLTHAQAKVLIDNYYTRQNNAAILMAERC